MTELPDAPGPETAATPYFTVILTAYNRRTYLPRAIGSVLAQSFPRSGYEVIVVKNFDDEASDRLIREHGLVGLFRTETALGIHLKAALDRARGEVVAFLNDDDLWEPGKLERVAELFRSRPSLGFHATSYSVIDEDDRPASKASDRFSGLERFAGREGRSFSAGPASSPEELARFVEANPGSDSTISLRTAILRRFSSDLEVLPSSVDTFLLTCGLLSGSDLLIEYVPLTRLRVHRENMSRATDQSFRSYLEKYARTMTGFAAARRQMVRMAESAGNPWLRDRWASKARNLDHFSGMARGDLGRRDAFRSLQVELASRPIQRGLAASSMLYLASPSVCRAVNFLVGRRIAGG
ncbi:MAG TPA: glycosyltransferase family A protein [Thermoplasmata archaeon]|nr:glycosyltransferase family A protein [Thermoplasmata archaeon]